MAVSCWKTVVRERCEVEFTPLSTETHRISRPGILRRADQRDSCRPARRDSCEGIAGNPGLALLRRALALGSAHVAPQGGAELGAGNDERSQNLEGLGLGSCSLGAGSWHPSSLFELRCDSSGICHWSRVLQRTQKPLQREPLWNRGDLSRVFRIYTLCYLQE